MIKPAKRRETTVWAGIMCLPLILSGCPKPDRYKAGTYTASAEGYGGAITVEVEFDGNALLKVSIVEEQETEWFMDRVIDAMPDRIIQEQIYDVDAFSGATVTSEAIKAAVKDCMEQAFITQPARDK